MAVLTEQMQAHFGTAGRVLFVPYALKDHDRFLEVMTSRGLNAGLELEGIHRARDPVAAIERAQGIYLGGGNSFRLLKALYDLGLLEPIRARVRAGMPYMGVSAGANMACPTMMTTNDMPIVRPPSFDALGLVPFQINPHYYNGRTFVRTGEQLIEHFGETRDDRIAEFHEENAAPVIGLWEGSILLVEDGECRLAGGPARLFRRGAEPVDVPPGGAIWPPTDEFAPAY